MFGRNTEKLLKGPTMGAHTIHVVDLALNSSFLIPRKILTGCLL